MLEDRLYLYEKQLPIRKKGELFGDNTDDDLI